MFGYRHDDLTRFKRPVRTRMPGSLGGDRSGILAAPIPITARMGYVTINVDDYASPLGTQKWDPRMPPVREDDCSSIVSPNTVILAHAGTPFTLSRGRRRTVHT